MESQNLVLRKHVKLYEHVTVSINLVPLKRLFRHPRCDREYDHKRILLGHISEP